MDGLLQPRIGGLYHGVSRQANLQRSPSQMQELDNFLPSVDLGGFVDRNGTRLVAALDAGYYESSGHHFFRTGDGQRWVILNRAEDGLIEVRNLVSGQPASVSYGAYTQAYLGSGNGLKYLTVSDTTFIVNPGVVVRVSVPGRPALTTAYLVVKRLSTGAQAFTVSCNAGSAAWSLAQGAANVIGRDFVALGLNDQINSKIPGLSAFRVAPNVVRVAGSAALIASLQFTNDWDETAALLIKDRVSAVSDLPPVFEGGVPILVDLGQGSTKSQYYVQYDQGRNAWIECSYLPSGQTTATLDPSTLPIKLRQIGLNSFDLQPCPWVPRKTGDDTSNVHPPFVDRGISSVAVWKGRLWFASGDTVVGSQPDDLFNFYRSSAREVVASDPVTLRSDVADAGSIQWLVPFNSKLMVMTDTAQMEIPGEKPVTPTDAVMGTATRYQLDNSCEPRVVGDSMYYTGPSANRSVLWEYKYDMQVAGNQAEDLSKHIPGYVPGRVQRIYGSAQSGRLYVWSPSDPSRLYVQTSYWKDSQRAQNAWSRISFPYVTNIAGFWVYEDLVYIAAVQQGKLMLLSLPVESDLGEDINNDFRLDFSSLGQLTWNATRNRTEFIYPAGYEGLNGLTVLANLGDGWWREYPVTTVWDGTQWLGHFPDNIGVVQGWLGYKFTRSATFSPFYPTVGDKTTPLGRLQVNRVTVDTMAACDFTATVTRPDRIPMVTAVSPRTIGTAVVPAISHDKSFPVPFNSKGDVGSLTITSTSTGPLCITGLTLQGRYTNTTQS